LAVEVQRVRRQVQGQERDLTRVQQTLRAKDTELSRLYAEVEALEKRLAA
jgi:hypothetical protein